MANFTTTTPTTSDPADIYGLLGVGTDNEGKLLDPDALLAATNLSYTASPTQGVVVSDTGNDATIPAADGTNAGLFLPAEKTKLAGIAAGAEVNVNADWNAGSGDAQILNKPTLITDHAALSSIGTNTHAQIDTHIGSTLNPHSVTKAQVGLDQVDNTSDLSKPVSTATQTALGNKQDTLVSATNIKTINSTSLLGSGDIAINGATNLSYTASPTQGVVASDTGNDATIPAADGTNAGLFLPAEKTKLAGITTQKITNWDTAYGWGNHATAGYETTTQLNARDTANRNRANHTGTQLAATISDIGTTISANTDVAANTAARHAAVTVTDSSEIDFTLTGQNITASLINGSIGATRLSSGVNTSLGLANTALQPSTIGVTVQGYSAILAGITTQKITNWDTAYGWGNHATAGYETTTQLNARDTANRNRANHTGTQPWNTITGTPTTTAGYGITDAAFNGQIINGVAHFVQNAAPTTRIDAAGQNIGPLVAGDRWYKKDDATEWFWNGTYWLSSMIYRLGSPVGASNLGVQVNTGSYLTRSYLDMPATVEISYVAPLFFTEWVVELRTIGPVHDSTNYYSVEPGILTGGGSTTLPFSADTRGISGGGRVYTVPLNSYIGQSIYGSAAIQRLWVQGFGTAPGFRIISTLNYRLVA